MQRRQTTCWGAKRRSKCPAGSLQGIFGVFVALFTLTGLTGTAIADACEPILLEEGDVAPCDGLLFSMDDAAKLFADLNAANMTIEMLRAELDKAEAESVKPIEEAFVICDETIKEVTTPVVVEKEIPWWVWVAIGGSLGVGFGVGLWVK